MNKQKCFLHYENNGSNNLKIYKESRLLKFYIKQDNKIIDLYKNNKISILQFMKLYWNEFPVSNEIKNIWLDDFTKISKFLDIQIVFHNDYFIFECYFKDNTAEVLWKLQN